MMYSEKHTIEMAGSYSCLRLDDSRVFSVEVYENEKNQKYFEYDGKIVSFERLTVGQLAKIIILQEEFKVSKLWKIDIDKSKLNPGSTDDDIKKLGGVSMGFEYDFIYYFPNDYKPTRNKIHIVAVVATTTTDSHKRLRTIRCFCSSNRVDPVNNFYIKPEELVKNLGTHIVAGKFCLFHGHRQSGKTTAAWELKSWIEANSKHKVFYMNFNSGITTNEGLSQFWRSVCIKVQSTMPKLVSFPAELEGGMNASTFEELFNKDKTELRDIILIIDEASRLIGDNDDSSWQILNDFVASLRVLRDQKTNMSVVHSVVLVGTEIIKDFLARARQSKNPTSTISPFSAEGVFNSTRFTSLEVKELLAQYAEENMFEIDVDNIAADVYSLTLGHKGLVGACCYYLEEKIMSGSNKATFDVWEKHVPIQLPQFIKGLATYTSIVRCLGALNENQREILGEVLRYGDKEVLMDNDDVKLLLAEGMVVENSQNDGMGHIGCAAPILRTIMLSNIRDPDIVPISPTDADCIDPKWLLARTVENLYIQNIFHEKTLNANKEPSEYAFQVEFLGIFKQLLSKAYPHLGYRVLPEVKERDENGRRRQRLDILVRNKELPVYGFELSVAASETVFDDHLERSNYYSRIHECHEMYTIDICHSNKLANYFGKQRYSNVIPVHVIYNLKDGNAKLVYENEGMEKVSLNGVKWQMVWD